MLEIVHSLTSRRQLEALSPSTRRLLTQLLHGVAELADLFPEEPERWSRLGVPRGTGLEITVERIRLTVAVRRGALRVLDIQPVPVRRLRRRAPAGKVRRSVSPSL